MKANDPNRGSIRRYGQVTPNRFRTIQAPDRRSQCVRSPSAWCPSLEGDVTQAGTEGAPPCSTNAPGDRSHGGRERGSSHASPSSTRGGRGAGRRTFPRGTTGAEATRMLWGGKIGRFQSSFEQLAVALGRVARMEFSDPPRRSYVPDIFPKVLLTGGVLPAILRARGVTWASPKKRCLRRLVPFR